MLYECNRCCNLIYENKDIIIHKPFYLFLGSIISQIFICKDCLSKKGREKFDKAKKKFKNHWSALANSATARYRPVE